jgi:hypothetical protein
LGAKHRERMSTATKRKRADTGSDNYNNPYDDNDDDEEEPSFGRQSLPVANMPEDFDGDPRDGQEYLFIVRCVEFPSTSSPSFR